MAKPKTPLLAVDCAVFDAKGRVLLIRRGHPPFEGCYALPGGFVEVGEPVEAACRRELEEETGLKARTLRLVGVYSDPKRDPRGHTCSVVFLARIARAAPKAGDDAAAAEWVEDWSRWSSPSTTPKFWPMRRGCCAGHAEPGDVQPGRAESGVTHGDFDGKVILVTGGATGLGAAIAIGAARRGAKAVILNCTKSLKEAEATADAVRSAGAEAAIAQGDVAEDADCRKVAAACQRFGRLDALVNNAGITKHAQNHGDLDALTKEDFLRIFSVNTVGPSRWCAPAAACWRPPSARRC